MKINIYYGGRGLIGDPTLSVLSKIENVLKELNVGVTRYDLQEYKSNILALPQTLNDADGIILATTVEWFGIGGKMSEFLDAIWLYGNKEKIKSTYMLPIAMSTTYGERDALTNLNIAWETLGGLPAIGICGYIPEGAKFDDDKTYDRVIERRTEDLYRSINQKMPVFPSSYNEVKQKVSVTANLNLTQDEQAQLSEFASDDVYVQKQKSDIQELTSLFQDLMIETSNPEKEDKYIAALKKHFTAQPGFNATYKFVIADKPEPLIAKVNGTNFDCFYGEVENPNVELQLSGEVLQEILDGRVTFQRAFMGGQMKMKGDFRVLRTLDLLYPFQKAS